MKTARCIMMTALTLVLSLVSVVTAQLPSSPEGQARPGKPAPRPLYRDPVYDAPTDPVLCFNAQKKTWFMFYTARRATEPNTPGVTWVHGSQIGIAESADGGATWTYLGTARIDYTKGLKEYTYWAPEVICHNGTYHMYLSFVPGIFTNWDHPREIVHLTSKDMIQWTFDSVLDLKSDRVIDACVIQLPAGGWRMWYKDERAKMALSYADSNDLYRWEARGNAVSDYNGEGPKVIHWKGRYWLIADCWANGMRVWSSQDCLKWTVQDKPLIGSHGDAVVSGDRAWWFYFGGPRSARGRTTAINVVELSIDGGKLLAGDPDQPTSIQLLPQLEEEK